jgi:ABC-type branched-subunit amino acid transport system substrate-binding protein
MTTAMLPADTFQPPLNAVGRRRRVRRRVVAAVSVVVLLAGTALAVWTGIRWCGFGSGDSTSAAGECVGLSDGSYTFGNSGLDDVAGKIKTENDRVADGGGNYVRVALLSPLSSGTGPMSSGEILHAVQGAYVAQWTQNHSGGSYDLLPQIQLVLANEGSHETHWLTAVRQIEEASTGDHPIVGVVGLGVSLPQTRSAAAHLADHSIPMVGGALSADGLDTGSIPGLLNVSPSNKDYVKALQRYFATRPELTKAMLVADTNLDLYTNTLRDDFAGEFAAMLVDSPPQGFTGSTLGEPGKPARPALFSYLIQNLCQQGPDLVLFAGRRRDLDPFMDLLSRRSCGEKKFIVVTGATGLSSSSLSDAARVSGISMIYSTSDNAAQWSKNEGLPPTGYRAFQETLQAQFRDQAEDAIVDGYAVMHHDAVLTMVHAIRTSVQPTERNTVVPEPKEVFSQITNLNGALAVPGASGTLSYSSVNLGRAEGKVVPVLRTTPSGSVEAIPGPVYQTGTRPPQK